MRKAILVLSLSILNIYGSCWAATPVAKKILGSYTVTYTIPGMSQPVTDKINITRVTSGGYFFGLLNESVSLAGIARPNYVCLSTFNVTPRSQVYCLNYNRKKDIYGTVIITYPVDKQRRAIPSGAVFQSIESIPLSATITKSTGKKSKAAAAFRAEEQPLPASTVEDEED